VKQSTVLHDLSASETVEESTSLIPRCLRRKENQRQIQMLVLNSPLNQVINPRAQLKTWLKHGKNISCQDNDAAEDGN